MDRRVRRPADKNIEYSRKMGSEPRWLAEGKKMEYNRQRSAKRLLPASGYFSLQSLYVLICLTVSLLILPLILPPLPPPPFMLLLLPIGILVVLVILAFMPSNVRDLTYAYM
ncbi:protein AUXIN-REGULATED GENE INVOLVED IN ORGAN SIZE-like [Syzygium oleosum]|uniref:protein AUXIN-REGULATED GENE INVOLVED IN ORGAN SIZE-like n=1 Tax=Syzygium oleosum TaxID=219896 RepID=UPI0024B92D23|nr:protein AUXIN-REGULATED GENE INVOLVED IN ORGAN SIZE-like [Syzygium oleosum]